MSHYDTLNFSERQRMQKGNAGGGSLVSLVFIVVWIAVVGYALFGGHISLG